MSFETVAYRNEKVILIDQRKLPSQTTYNEYSDPEEVALAITDMVVRGAPAIGVTAAYGLALAAHNVREKPLTEAKKDFSHWLNRFAKARPTAVNLFWAIEEMKHCSEQENTDTKTWVSTLTEKAHTICREDVAACKRMGDFGAEFVPKGARILTHCNAGALATAGWGTALGVIRSAAAQGKNISVWVDETRPFLQGARLTAWELLEEKIPATLITDNMAGHMMAQGQVDLVVVGSDRIAANGDVANKIGTYSVAVLAKEHGIPFYVAAPMSTVDFNCPSGKEIPIEERNPVEVMEYSGVRVAPKDMQARHPAFDVTPAKYVTAIITENGVAKPPSRESLAALKK